MSEKCNPGCCKFKSICTRADDTASSAHLCEPDDYTYEMCEPVQLYDDINNDLSLFDQCNMEDFRRMYPDDGDYHIRLCLKLLRRRGYATFKPMLGWYAR